MGYKVFAVSTKTFLTDAIRYAFEKVLSIPAPATHNAQSVILSEAKDPIN